MATDSMITASRPRNAAPANSPMPNPPALTLISKEIQLAKSELKVSFKHGGTGIGLFAAAGFLGLLAIIMLSVAIAYFIHMTGLDLAWCFLIVFGAYLLLAGLLAFIGVKQVKQVKGPERAMAQGREIPAALKGRS